MSEEDTNKFKPKRADLFPVNIENIDIENYNISPDDVELPRSSNLSNAQVNHIIGRLNDKWEICTEDTCTVLAILFQQGATAKSCDGNLTIKYRNKEYKLAHLRAVLKQESLSRNERKLARSLATTIQKISTKLQIPGNLTKKIKQNFPQERISEEEIYWLSDFQTDNKDCPEHLRNLLTKNFQLGRTTGNKQKTQTTNSQ